MDNKNIIRVISETTVRPKITDHHDHHNNGPSRRVELTPSDLLLLLRGQIQKGILFRKPNCDSSASLSTNSIIHRLKSAFSRALGAFFPLAGRLVATEHDDGTTSFFVDCDGAGALFVHATTDGAVAVADILDPIFVPNDVVYAFFPLNGASNHDAAVLKSPLLATQVTELTDGLFVALTMNHCAGDGTTFWHFFNAWSEISRLGNDNAVVSRPVIGREYLDGVVDLPIHLPLHPDKTLSRPVTFQPLKQRMFRFSKAKIAALKAKANAEVDSTEISSLQALMAHLWISVTRNRRLGGDEEVRYAVAVGLRQRIRPPLPEEYLGNAVLIVHVVSVAGDLLRRGLGAAAWKINRAIAAQTAAEARRFFEDWGKSPPELRRKGDQRVNFLVTGSSPRFDVYGNDFGWGRPVAVRSGPGNKLDGKMTVFPGAEEGSIDFEVCLLAETLRSLGCDEEFLKECL